MLYRGQLDVFFQFPEDVLPLIQAASSVLTNWKGVVGFLTMCGSLLGVGASSVRECSSSEHNSKGSSIHIKSGAVVQTLVFLHILMRVVCFGCGGAGCS